MKLLVVIFTFLMLAVFLRVKVNHFNRTKSVVRLVNYRKKLFSCLPLLLLGKSGETGIPLYGEFFHTLFEGVFQGALPFLQPVSIMGKKRTVFKSQCCSRKWGDSQSIRLSSRDPIRNYRYSVPNRVIERSVSKHSVVAISKP